jgi:hypothetical protein
MKIFKRTYRPVSPLILSLDNWRSGQLRAPAPLTPGKGHPVSIGQEASRAGLGAVLKERITTSIENRTPVVQQIPSHFLTQLYQVTYSERKWSWSKILRYNPGICLEGLKKTTTNIIQDSRCPRRDLNPARHEYIAGVLNIFYSSEVFLNSCKKKLKNLVP